MNGMVSKLQTIGMLIALVSAIGGGFYTWGTFNQRLDVIETKEFVVNQEVDLTEVYKSIEGLKADIKINTADTEPDVNQNELSLEILFNILQDPTTLESVQISLVDDTQQQSTSTIGTY